MGVDRSSLSSPGVARRPARATGDGLAVVRQHPTSPGNYYGHIDDFGSCNLDSIHQGGPIFEGPTCFVRRSERRIMSRIFNCAEPGPQLIWTAMTWAAFVGVMIPSLSERLMMSSSAFPSRCRLTT